MSRIFFTSDPHFGHANIIKYCHRPFLNAVDRDVFEQNGRTWHKGDWKGGDASKHRISRESVEMMDNALLDNINKTVDKKDTLWILGDFAFGVKKDYRNVVAAYRERINCDDVRIVWGNHDQPREIWDIFTEDYFLHEINAAGLRIVLCHYAMAVWDKSHRGSLQLYGHSHSGAESWLETHMPGRRAMDVGVDNAAKLLGEYRPFNLDEILGILNTKSGHTIDHHKSPKDMAKTLTEEDLIGM